MFLDAMSTKTWHENKLWAIQNSPNKLMKPFFEHFAEMKLLPKKPVKLENDKFVNI